MSTTAPPSLLSVRDLTVRYGQIEAVKGITLELREGEITTLVGANGAGKSTTLLALSGLLRQKTGQIRFAGEDISRLPPHQIVARGLVQVAEGRAILTTMSVRENLELGAYTRRDDEARIRQDFEQVLGLFPRLKERLDGFAGNLSGGEQQMLAIGRALMARPRLLLLDEPSMGLAPLLVETIFEIIETIHDLGKTILLVEQNAYKALAAADYAYVLEQGVLVKEDKAQVTAEDPEIHNAYLAVAKA